MIKDIKLRLNINQVILVRFGPQYYCKIR